jgi:hypothetical protein
MREAIEMAKLSPDEKREILREKLLDRVLALDDDGRQAGHRHEGVCPDFG